MNITKNRPTADELVAVSNKPKAKWEGILKGSDVFISARDDDDALIGFVHGHGDSESWTLERIWVATDYRGQGIGRAMRIRCIKECEKFTVGNGVIRGFSTDEAAPFWDAFEDTKVKKGFIGERHIRGTPKR